MSVLVDRVHREAEAGPQAARQGDESGERGRRPAGGAGRPDGPLRGPGRGEQAHGRADPARAKEAVKGRAAPPFRRSAEAASAEVAAPSGAVPQWRWPAAHLPVARPVRRRKRCRQLVDRQGPAARLPFSRVGAGNAAAPRPGRGRDRVRRSGRPGRQCPRPARCRRPAGGAVPCHASAAPHSRRRPQKGVHGLVVAGGGREGRTVSPDAVLGLLKGARRPKCPARRVTPVGAGGVRRTSPGAGPPQQRRRR